MMNDAFELPFPQYRCPTCGKDLPLGEARMTVTCASHMKRDAVEFTVRRAEDADADAVALICERAMGETDVDLFGRTFDVMAGVNFVAMSGDELVGLLALAINRGELTVVLLSVYPDFQGTGVGSALLSAADEFATKRGLQFLRVAITNDDIPQLYFYQRHGFAIYEIAVGEITDRFGSATPGFSGIPVRDEIRLRRAVRAQ
ncbi:MAG: GNAT family N-acetyltransferase [Coriobacteriia bacterium]|nr:GNAT family N-acetyltransferase [Coriobacteriia bacterium]